MNEIAIRDNYNYSLYNEINGYENNLIKASSNETSEFIKSIYSDLCYDATKGFIGYSLDRKVKAIKPSLSDSMYKKLTEALKHLQNIVLDSENRPNKEKERFANQIENLASKWEHTRY